MKGPTPAPQSADQQKQLGWLKKLDHSQCEKFELTPYDPEDVIEDWQLCKSTHCRQCGLPGDHLYKNGRCPYAEGKRKWPAA